MYRLYLEKDGQILNGPDTLQSKQILDIFDDENEENTINLVIDTTNFTSIPEENYPNTVALIFNISPSINIENEDLPIELSISVQNSTEININNDKRSFEGYGYIGVFFSSDSKFIYGFERNQEISKKFALFPQKIGPGLRINVRLKIRKEFVESRTRLIRNKFFPYKKFIYNFSDSYISSVETKNSVSLYKLYKSKGRRNSILLIKKESLLNEIFTAEDLLFEHLAVNNIYVLDDGTLDSFLLSYEENILSDYAVDTSSSDFLYVKYRLQDVLIPEQQNTINSDTYLKEASKLVITEMMKPVMPNTSFNYTNLLNNIIRISKFLIKILEDLKNKNVKDMLINNSYWSGSVLADEYQDIWFSVFYLISSFFVEFSNRLTQTGYLNSIPVETNNLKTYLLENYQTFVDLTNKVNVRNFLDENTLETDFIVSLLYLLALYEISGKNIFGGIKKLKFYLWHILPYSLNIAKNLAFKKPGVNPNTLSNQESASLDFITTKALLLSLYSSLLVREEFFVDFRDLLYDFGVLNLTITEDENSYSCYVSLDSFSDPKNEQGSGGFVFLYPGGSSNVSYKNKTVILFGNDDLTDPVAIFPSELFTVEYSSNSLIIKANKFYFTSANEVIIPKFFTEDLHETIINFHVKLYAKVIDNIYYFTNSNTNRTIDALNDIELYNHLKILLSGNFNNKISQNTINIKAILKTVY